VLNKGEQRNYVWQDVLVQDILRNPVENATVTVENINNSNYIAIKVFLPSPPFVLQRYPGNPLNPDPGISQPRVESLLNIKTLSDGHTPPPNYGWSNDTEPTITLMFQWRNKTTTITNFTYRIYAGNTTKLVLGTTNYVFPDRKVYTNYTDITPDSSWYRPYNESQNYQNTTTLTLKSYNLTNISVTPETGKVIATINTWNPSGNETLINFTANTTNGNNVYFTICSLKSDTNYLIKKDNTNFTIKTTNSTGCLTFNNSQWTQHIFTIEKTNVTHFCGDGTCNDDESCSSCSQDCGTCPSEEQTTNGGTSGGSSSGTPTTNETNETIENETTVKPTIPINKTNQTTGIPNPSNQTTEPKKNQTITGEIQPETNQTSPAPFIPEQLVYPTIGLIIVGIISGLIYFRKSDIIEILTKLKPTDNLNNRIEKIEQKVYEIKLKGEDTTEIENELEIIRKDLKIGLKSVAKIRLEKVEKKYL
jgi:hypothetical protein